VGPLTGHTQSVNSAFSQNGKNIVSGSMAQTIQIWDADTGEVNSTIMPQNAIFPSPEQTPIHIFSVLNTNQVDSFSDTSTLAAGWIHNSSSELLFWVPFWHRLG